MKRALSFVLTLTMLMSLFTVPAFAATTPTSDQNNAISFEEYNSTVTKEYAKFHIKYECVDYDRSFVFTDELLKQKLEEIRETASQFNYSPSIGAFIEPSVQIASVKPKTISPFGFTDQVNYYTYVTAKSPSNMGAADIEITTNVTRDVQASKFVRINSCKSRQYGGGINFKSWKHVSDNLSINASQTMVNGTVKGTLTIEYTEPTTGIKVTYSSDHAWLIGFSF